MLLRGGGPRSQEEQRTPPGPQTPHLPPRRPQDQPRRGAGTGALTCPSEPSPPRIPLLPIVSAAAAVIP